MRADARAAVAAAFGTIALLAAGAVAWAGIAPGYIDKIVAAHGGPAALEKTASYRVAAETVALRRGGKRGRVVRDVAAPGRQQVTVEYPDRTEIRILDGERGWRGTTGDLAAVEGPRLDAMRYQLLRSDLPGALARNRNRLVDGGLAQGADGGAYRVLILPVSDTLEVRYWIEAGSLRVGRVVGTIRAGGGTIGFETEYADYREVDGVWLPFREINHASGEKVAETVVRSVTWSPDDLGPFAPD